jgi:3-deoxy-7-phosphoheptulonate synthase
VTTARAPWSPRSWRGFPAAQQPAWEGEAALAHVLARIGALPPLVVLAEIDALRARLAEVAAGRAFVLQGGDCAESFAAVSASGTRRLVLLLERMRLVLSYGLGLDVVAIARLAGQYAKPRSAPTERVGGRELPSYRGDIVNRMEATAAARRPDPENMLTAYFHAAATLNHLRADVGARDPARALDDLDAVASPSPQAAGFAALVEAIRRAHRWARLGDPDEGGAHRGAGRAIRPIDTSHEGLLLGYEEALLREDEATGRWFAGSAHFLWIGERTRQVDGAHVEMLRGLANPVGVKLGPGARPDEVRRLLDVLDPAREPGRVVLVARMGRDNVERALPPLVRATRDDGRPVAWICDPMHGNTVRSPNGYKTRHVRDILGEIRGFFAVHRALGTHAGGLHLEMTGDAVTECAGGAEALTEIHLADRYHTHCDPRLNARQALEIALLVAREQGPGAAPAPGRPA